MPSTTHLRIVARNEVPRAPMQPAPFATPAAPPRPPAARIDELLLRELYRSRTLLLAGNLGGAALVVCMLWGDAVRADLVLWAVLVAGVTLLRLVLVRRFDAAKPGLRDVAFWTWTYTAGAFAGGALWGASVGLFSHLGTEIGFHTLVLLLAGLGAAALSAYAVCPLVFAAFLLPATLPFGMLLAYHGGGGFRPAVAGLFLAWLAIMIGAAFWRSRCIAEDIKRARAETERAVQAELEREIARRGSEEKARILAQLSHEMRTPLNAIVGFSEAIKHGVFGPIGNPRYAAYADNIYDSGRHLLSVIERTLVDRDRGPATPPMAEGDVDLALIAAEASSMFEARAKQCGVVLVLAVEEPPPAVHGNAEKLKQVLVNLLSNAVKYTRPGGRITIEIAAPPREGVILRVADTGVGMAPEEIARALDSTHAPARRAEPGLESGRGVGLLIAKWLTELHGGRLVIKSTRGSGTTVTAHLPGERLLLRVRAPESRVNWREAAE